MFKPVLPLLLLLLCGRALAAPEISDYAFQAVISETDQKLQRLELPLEVIMASTRSDLGDLAIFNFDGKQMPHSVTVTPDTTSERVLDLPFHKFDRFLQQQTKIVTTREQNQQANSTSELETTERIAVQSVRNDYLIELVPDKRFRTFERLDLKWRHEPASQILQVRIEVGNELDRLRTIRSRKSLTNSQSGDPDWRSIKAIPAHNKYLRLTPLNDVTSFELQQVSGHYKETLDAPTLIHTFTPGQVSDEAGEFYFFKYPSVVRAEAMRIIPGDKDSIIVGDLYISNSSEPDKRRLAERGFRQHNLSDDEVKPSQPFNMSRLYPVNIWFSSTTDLPSPPRVELRYPQYEVVFLGDGNGPYRLAWGNHAHQTVTANLNELLAGNLKDTQQRGALVQLGRTEEAGGADRLRPQKTLPWKKWLLWALLVLAALITGRMAYRLYQEMNAENPGS
ncbi:MAG: DUF3999 domain-containing protein [Gammaproteobacteria bacterium]|nr:DUF3999 domain-containing protein [Gammaproteobacteria bacterium]